MDPVGKLEIVMFANGTISVRGQFPGGRMLMLGVMEEAKLLLLDQFEKKSKEPGVVVAPPGFRLNN